MGMEKEYTGTFTLGAVTPTYDLESEPAELKDISQLNDEQIHEATQQFTGTIQQIPPIHSAIKKMESQFIFWHAGEKMLFSNHETITIKEFKIVKIELPIVHFKVVCKAANVCTCCTHYFKVNNW